MSDTLKEYGLVSNEHKCLNRFYADGQTLLCQKPIGHGAWHESGDYEWKTESIKRAIEFVPHVCTCGICSRHFPTTLSQIADYMDSNFSREDRPFAGDVLRESDLYDDEPREQEPRP